MFNDIRAVLFDLDGTLIDSAPDLASAANKMRLDRGMASLPLERYRPVAGAGAKGMLAEAFAINAEHSEFASLREEFFSNYQNCMFQHTAVFDGVENLVNRLLQKGILWGVVTNKSARFTNPLTSSIPLFATAGAIVSGDSTPYAKPHPAPLLEAAARLNLEPCQCLYVGDDERDIVAGLAAGMSTVAATYGYIGRGSDPLTWGAHASIKSPRELLQLLANA